MLTLYLEYNNLLNYLCSLGQFTFDDAIEGGLVIKKKTTKNNTFEVFSDCKIGVFVKQFTEFNQYPFNNLWREKLIRNYVPFYEIDLAIEVRSALTEIIATDDDRQVIITKRIKNLHRLKSIPDILSISDKLLKILKYLHETKNIKRNLKRKLEFTPYFFDKILSKTREQNERIDIEFWSQFYDVQKPVSIFLKKRWAEQEDLIHNDLNFNNILLDNNNKLYLVDWEYLAIGDKLWDYASLVYDLEFNQYPQYKQFLEVIFSSQTNEIDKKIIDFYSKTIELWRISLDLERVTSSKEFDRILNESISKIKEFEKILVEINNEI